MKLLKRKSFLILICLAVVVALGAIAWQRQRSKAVEPVSSAKQGANALEVSTADVLTATAGQLSRGVRLSGLLQPVRQAVLTAEVDGRIVEVSRRTGEPVKAGEVLARMDLADLNTRVAQQNALVAASRAQVDIAEKTLQRNEALLAKNFISPNSVDNSRSTVDANRESLKAAEAQLALSKQALSKATVRAPISGILAERRVEPGQHVGINAPLFSVVDLGTLEFAANVPVNEMGAIRVGQETTLSIEGLAGAVSGKVVRISPVADSSSRMIPVFVSVANPEGQLKGGMVAQGRIAVADSGDTVLISDQVIRKDGDKRFAFVIAAGVVERRELELGEQDEDKGIVAVRSGLAAGDNALLARIGGLVPGQRITVVAP